MKKTDLEQLVKDLIEMNKYLIKENEELKKDLKKGREVFLETIDRWDKSVERLTKK
jgi:regulator of replication initiation timing